MKRIWILVCVLLATTFSGAASFENIGYADIATATLSADRIDGSDGVTNQLTTGTIVLYQTTEGRYGKFQVLEYGKDLRIEWITFRPNETVHSRGELTVRGTFDCDLDAGRESSASADFFWQMATATERYLVPQNGATFAVYDAAPPPDLGIATDKQQYTPGETISFTITIPADCDYRIRITQPDGTSAEFMPDLSSALISAPGWITIHMTGTTETETGMYTAVLLCENRPQAQVQYAVGSTGAAGELTYDDGTAESARGKASAGMGYAVRFTPPPSGGTLIQGRFHIEGFGAAGAGPIEVRVWDASRNLVDVPIVVTPTQEGWFSVDLSGYGFAPTGDFYIGYVQLSATAHPWIGLDTSGGEGRSHNVPDWSSFIPQGANIMIRAVLSASQAPPSAGPSLTTDKAQYAQGEEITFTICEPPACSYAIALSQPDASVTDFIPFAEASSISPTGQVMVSLTGVVGTQTGIYTASLYCETDVGLPFALAQTTFSVGTSGGAQMPPTGQGSLQLTSTPSGVQVYIDGEYKGTTPLIVQLGAGAHTVMFRRTGYPDVSRTMTIHAGAWHSAHATFGQ